MHRMHEMEAAAARYGKRECPCRRKPHSSSHRGFARARQPALSGLRDLECLQSPESRTRKAAAESLGRLRSLEAYGPLLAALGREPESHDARIAIIGALARIGSAHVAEHSARLRAGQAPIMRFILGHIGDTGMVERSLQALSWTIRPGEASKLSEEIKAAASIGKNPEAARAASDFYLDSILR